MTVSQSIWPIQSLSCVWPVVTPWTVARQASHSSPSSRACSKLLRVQQKSLQPSEASLTSLWNLLCLETSQQIALQSSPVLILRGIRRRWPSPTGETEIRGGWAAGWAAGVGPLWTDTPRWRQEQEGGEAEPCPDKKETTCFSFSRSKRTFWLYMDRKPSWRSKGRGASPHSKWYQLPIGLFARLYLG